MPAKPPEPADLDDLIPALDLDVECGPVVEEIADEELGGLGRYGVPVDAVRVE
jgi:hypothetical protein